MPLERLIYVSRARGSAADDLLTVSEIVGASAANNRRDDVTGILLAHQGRFLQAVEGRSAALDRLMARIEADPRHTQIEVLERRVIAERQFPYWEMAHGHAPEGAPSFDTLDAKGAFAVLSAAAELAGTPEFS